MSYELRTPLTNIIGFSELLGKPAHRASSTSKQREYLGDISASSKTLLAIIDDILDLATIDAGAMELKLAPVDVPAVIDAAILGVRERAPSARASIADIARRRRCDGVHRRRGARAADALQSAVERHRLLQARRHHRHHAAGARAA